MEAMIEGVERLKWRSKIESSMSSFSVHFQVVSFYFAATESDGKLWLFQVVSFYFAATESDGKLWLFQVVSFHFAAIESDGKLWLVVSLYFAATESDGKLWLVIRPPMYPQHSVLDPIDPLLPKLPSLLSQIYSKNPMILQSQSNRGGFLKSSFRIMMVINYFDLCESPFLADSTDCSQGASHQATSIVTLEYESTRSSGFKTNRWAIPANCSGLYRPLLPMTSPSPTSPLSLTNSSDGSSNHHANVPTHTHSSQPGKPPILDGV
ncbi:hypothetical protein Cgig2_008412 [Carnegiea gigantea]|uniref:Uncharacterized protein n=1 Tax=Carnegiea gigantea TaxID=171969 RepID=A0A9Q1JTT2_9CARY|nr:hypothetical protein Cgig2_008412 [Carnegiea gigantea]